MTLQDFARGFIQMTHSVAFHAWWQREAILAVILMTRPEGIGGTLKCPYSPPTVRPVRGPAIALERQSRGV